MLVFAAALPAGAEDDTPTQRLQQARQLELVVGRTDPTAYDRAIRLYREVCNDPMSSEAQKGKALMGLGRCLKERGRHDEMADAFKGALDVEGLDARDRSTAELELQKYKQRKAEETREQDIDEAAQKQLEQERARQAAKAAEYRGAAWAALREGRPDEARSLAMLAMALVGETPETIELWEAIERASPDRGELLRNLMEFLGTVKIQDYQDLRAKVQELYKAARDQLSEGKYRVAAEMFVDAIRMIDTSGFLGDPSIGAQDELRQDRDLLVVWYRETADKAKEAGVEIPPEPKLPEQATRGNDFARQFYALLADAFGSLGSGSNPVRFYELKSATRGMTPWVAARGFPRGISVAQTGAELSRSRWVERHILSDISGKWGAKGPVVGRPGGRKRGITPRVLERFGDVLCVQHRESMHKQIEKLASSFADRPVPFIADVHVLTTTTAGLVTASQALAAYASPRESGRDLLLRDKLVSECLEILLGLEGRPVKLMGSAELHLAGESRATIEIMAQTAEHPQYRGLSPPQLTVEVGDARYGIALALYAESLGNAPGPEHNAVSVVTRVTRPIGSVVVPRQSGDLSFTRVPRMTEQRLDADRKMPGFGTLMLVGLKNPFPGGGPEADEMFVLIGLRPEGGRMPDPPMNGAGGPFVEADSRMIERTVGPLGTEVLDHLVQEDWPRQRAASEPLPFPTLQDHRDRYLEDMVARGANLLPPGRPASPSDLPITVNRGRVSGVLDPAEIGRLDTYLSSLTRHAADLYDVDVVSVVANKQRFLEWAGAEGSTSLRETNDWYRLDRAAAESVDAQMRGREIGRSLFAMERRQNARATQKIGFKRLALETIVRDQHVRRIGQSGARYAAIQSVVEEGLIVEVRPRLEQEGNYRMVSVRARAAGLETIRRSAYPGTTNVFIEAPVWFPLENTTGAYPMKDGQALLVSLPVPGVQDRVIAIKVEVKRLK